MAGDFEEQVAGVAALNDPVRRALYFFVAGSDDAVGREQAAAAVGIQRPLAAFHLDKLADEGLLDVEFRRLSGRTGPGAGRPAKLYRRSDRQIDVSLPPRHYDLAGLLLAEAIDTAGATDGDVRAQLERASSAYGRRLGQEALARAGARPSRSRQREALVQVLAEHGFDPRTTQDGIVLSNCPFHALAQRFTDLVCGMNLHLLRGMRDVLTLAADELVPTLAPQPGQCCVTFCRSPA